MKGLASVPPVATLTSAHYHTGIDPHKRFSPVHIRADHGSTVWKGRIKDNDPAAVEGLVRMLGGRQPGNPARQGTGPFSKSGPPLARS